MHFLNPEEDKALRDQLVPAVIADSDLMKLTESAKIESGGLFEDVIIPNAAKFDQVRWIYWQVRRLKLERINGLVVTPEFIRYEGFTTRQCQLFAQWQTYPIGRDSSGRNLLVAVGRGEYLPEASRSLGPSPILLASAPNELAAIIKVYYPFTR